MQERGRNIKTLYQLQAVLVAHSPVLLAPVFILARWGGKDWVKSNTKRRGGLQCIPLQLHQVLAESDRALAAVKDIFGDDPKVHLCVCITTAYSRIVA